MHNIGCTNLTTPMLWRCAQVNHSGVHPLWIKMERVRDFECKAPCPCAIPLASHHSPPNPDTSHPLLTGRSRETLRRSLNPRACPHVQVLGVRRPACAANFTGWADCGSCWPEGAIIVRNFSCGGLSRTLWRAARYGRRVCGGLAMSLSRECTYVRGRGEGGRDGVVYETAML